MTDLQILIELFTHNQIKLLNTLFETNQ